MGYRTGSDCKRLPRPRDVLHSVLCLNHHSFSGTLLGKHIGHPIQAVDRSIVYRGDVVALCNPGPPDRFSDAQSNDVTVMNIVIPISKNRVHELFIDGLSYRWLSVPRMMYV